MYTYILVLVCPSETSLGLLTYVVLPRYSRRDLVALLLRDRGVGLPAHAYIDLARNHGNTVNICTLSWGCRGPATEQSVLGVRLPVVGPELVPAVVLEAEQAVGVGIHAVVPDLLELGREFGRRTPAGLSPTRVRARAGARSRC